MGIDRYQEALERARTIYKSYDCGNKDLEYIFPELAESRDEQIRKDIIKTIKNEAREFPASVIATKANTWIAWLEKQGPANSTMSEKDEIDSGFTRMMEKSEFKFKEGDWVISNDGDKLRHTLEVRPGGYMSDYGWLSKDAYESIFRLWTIQDAKPGDVLSWDHERYTIILKEIKNNKIIAWCSYNNHSDYFGTAPSYYDTKFDIELGFKPASTKARETLFAKMWEAGYDWNNGNLSLRKIQENPEGYSDKDMARFIGNAITTDEASDYLKEKHIEISAAHVWLDRVTYKPDYDQLTALSSAIKVMNPKDSDLLLKLYNDLTK